MYMCLLSKLLLPKKSNCINFFDNYFNDVEINTIWFLLPFSVNSKPYLLFMIFSFSFMLVLATFFFVYFIVRICCFFLSLGTIQLLICTIFLRCFNSNMLVTLRIAFGINYENNRFSYLFNRWILLFKLMFIFSLCITKFIQCTKIPNEVFH